MLDHDTIAALLEEHKVPGVAVGVWHAGQTQLSGFGVTSLPNPLPVTPETIFQVGSITKTFVATAVMALVEQGKVALDEPLRSYLPELTLQDATAQEQVTLRHLLNHSGGWAGDYFADCGRGDDALAEMVRRVGALPQLLPFGTLFSYNNAGFALVGRVIEKITDMPFERAVAELIFAPLGLDQTFFFAEDVMLQRFAVGHIQRDGQTEVASPWPIGRAANPAGGICSSVGDLLRYARFHIGKQNSGFRIQDSEVHAALSAESLALMRQPTIAADTIGSYEAVGLAWFLRTLNGVTLVNHGGATNGQIAALTLVPERDFAVAVLTNANNGGLITKAVADMALEHYLGIHEEEPATLAIDTAALDTYCGRYTSQIADIEVVSEAGRLIVKVQPKGGFPNEDSPPAPTPPPAPLRFFATDQAIVAEGPARGSRAVFGRDTAGDIAWLRFGGRVRLRNQGTSRCRAKSKEQSAQHPERSLRRPNPCITSRIAEPFNCNL
ncbi:beta-lactamase family protein [Candidatus Gracilibacteria bacterium]|nr:beta-lactamase family protein [Candidatus Gracilibacteria bacterium]